MIVDAVTAFFNYPYAIHIVASLIAFFTAKFIYSFVFSAMHILWDEPVSLNSQGRPQRAIGKVPPYFPNGWFKICDSFELGKGQSKYVQVLGQHLVLYRGENGVAAILDAYCPHLV